MSKSKRIACYVGTCKHPSRFDGCFFLFFAQSAMILTKGDTVSVEKLTMD